MSTIRLNRFIGKQIAEIVRNNNSRWPKMDIMMGTLIANNCAITKMARAANTNYYKFA